MILVLPYKNFKALQFPIVALECGVCSINEHMKVLYFQSNAEQKIAR